MLSRASKEEPDFHSHQQQRVLIEVAQNPGGTLESPGELLKNTNARGPTQYTYLRLFWMDFMYP